MSKNQLDICLDNGEKEQIFAVSNIEAGIQKWVEDLSKNSDGVRLIICEATGGYEKLVVQTLKAHHFPLHTAHPNKIRHFARNIGILAKTDRIDSRILSHYARVFQPPIDLQEISPETQTLQLFLKRRQQLIDQKIEGSNRLDKPLLQEWVKESIHEHIAWLEHKITEIEKKISQHVQESLSLKQSIEDLMSVPGVGCITATTLFAFVPELGSLCHKTLSALVGVAPLNRDSGKTVKKRSIYGGRKEVRKTLYMATVASLIHNPYLKACYHKLKAKGKPSKVAIVACMRKLVIILNAIAKRKSPWVQTLQGVL